MNIVASKKIIAMLIVAVMIVTMTTPIFAAATVSSSRIGSAKTSFDVKEGETITVYIKSNDYNGNIYWSSNNSSIAKIMGGTNSYCTIKGAKANKSTTIKIREGSQTGRVAGEFTINVKESGNSGGSFSFGDSSNRFSFLTALLNITVKGFEWTTAILQRIFEIDIIPTPDPNPDPEPEPVAPSTSITKTVSQSYINSINKVDLSDYFGGGKVITTKFYDSQTASQVTKNNSKVKYDPTNKWLTYNGKIAVATASKGLRANAYRSDIYYFDLFDELYLKINGTWYEAIVIDKCGAAMNPNELSGGYYDDGRTTNHSKQVIDIWTNSGSGLSNYYSVDMVIPR